jgi:hypothetical protein
MKRIAILFLLAAAARTSAADLPLPTGYAPTSPSVPAPVFKNGTKSEPVSQKTGVVAAAASGAACGPRVPSLRPFQNSAVTQTTWCENCAPAVKRPLPGLPAGITDGKTAAVAPRSGHDGSCCEKLKNWICFHYTPVHTPHIPTPKQPALWSYFPTVEGPGYGGGCADGRCGKVIGHAIGAKSCVSCPTSGEAIGPGYRLANPEK